MIQNERWTWTATSGWGDPDCSTMYPRFTKYISIKFYNFATAIECGVDLHPQYVCVVHKKPHQSLTNTKRCNPFRSKIEFESVWHWSSSDFTKQLLYSRGWKMALKTLMTVAWRSYHIGPFCYVGNIYIHTTIRLVVKTTRWKKKLSKKKGNQKDW